MEKETMNNAAAPPPPQLLPPLPPPAPRHYIQGQGLGIRNLNAIRRNLVYPPRNPAYRFSSHEPIPLPLGLEHLNHIPPPKPVRSTRDHHSECGVVPTETRLTRQQWKPHHAWVSRTQLRREQRKDKNYEEVASMDIMNLPKSMQKCYDRFARKWRREGLNVPTTWELEEEAFVLNEERLKTDAPLPGFRKSYERYSNNLGWKTKAQVFGRKTATDENFSASAGGHVTQVKGRCPTGVKSSADTQQQQQPQPQPQPITQGQAQSQKQVNQQSSPSAGVLVKENDKKKYKETHKGQHIRYDEKNIKETFHPVDKDYGHDKIDEPPTPFPRSSSSPQPALDINEVVKRLDDVKANQTRDSRASMRGSVTDMAKEHYRGMGKVLMQSKSINEQIAIDEEEEEERKKKTLLNKGK